jgi:hypothetical protein
VRFPFLCSSLLSGRASSTPLVLIEADGDESPMNFAAFITNLKSDLTRFCDKESVLNNELLKDHPVGDARPVAAEGMVHFPVGQQGGELLPDGLDDVWWHCGDGVAPSVREASVTPRNDRAIHVRLHSDTTIPIGAS